MITLPRRLHSARGCTPLFSEQDADLRAWGWRTKGKGYAAVGGRGADRAKTDRRTVSAYIAGLVEADARNAGLLVNGDAALLEVVREARASGVDVVKVLAKARRAAR